jgi:hypothetical protein
MLNSALVGFQAENLHSQPSAMDQSNHKEELKALTAAEMGKMGTVLPCSGSLQLWFSQPFAKEPQVRGHWVTPWVLQSMEGCYEVSD